MTTYILNFMAVDNLFPQETRESFKESLEEIYKRYYNNVYKICLKMTSNTADAEDLTHDVFLQLHRKLASFRGDSSFTTWLHRITVNQVLMHFRKKSVKLEITTQEGETPETDQPFTLRTKDIPIVERIALADAIEQLPPGYKKIFLLHDVQGYGHDEIANLLGINAGTSKSQLHKARMKLRALLNKHNELINASQKEG